MHSASATHTGNKEASQAHVKNTPGRSIFTAVHQPIAVLPADASSALLAQRPAVAASTMIGPGGSLPSNLRLAATGAPSHLSFASSTALSAGSSPSSASLPGAAAGLS